MRKWKAFLPIIIITLLFSSQVLPAVNPVKATNLDSGSLLLLTSAQNGDSESVRRLVAEKVDIEVRDDYGRTALHVAAEYGQAEVAAFLIEAGADVEAKTLKALGTYFFWTPLTVAANWGHTSVAKLLIAAGADVNAFESGTRYNFNVLHFSAEKGHTEIVKLLIVNGADIEAKVESILDTPLSRAVRKERKATVEALISMGANVNTTNAIGSTPLHFAAISGNLDIVRLLLENGAEVNAKTNGGDLPGVTPIHAAAFEGQTRIVELLLVKGADINAVTQSGYTPLRRSVDQGDLVMAKLLLEKGGNIETTDKYGLTLLHIVAQTDQIELAEFLIEKGVEINARDKNSKFTPLDFALDGEDEMIEMLKRHGAICTTC